MRSLKKAEIFPYASYQLSEFTATRMNGQPDPHDHDFYELFIVKSGTLVHVQGEETEVMPTDCMGLVYPKPGHVFFSEGDSPASCVNITFSGEIFDMAVSSYANRTGGTGIPGGGRSVLMTHEMAKQMIGRFTTLDSGRLFFKSQLSDQLLVSIVVDAFALLDNQNEGVRSVPAWLQQACNKMSREENLVLGLPRFVELCGKSQEHVTRTMRKYYQQSPTAYINMLRLDRAASQLTTTSKSILDIMLDAGFENTSYFNKLFRERYHMPPSRYRANSISVLG